MRETEETFFAGSRAAWRAWLEKNHGSKNEIWLILLKVHVKRRCVSYDEAVEEALCFGWIDGKMRRIDDEKHGIRFTPRKPGSAWSDLNKRRVSRLVKKGRMTRAGLAKVEEAKNRGTWERGSGKRETDEVPPDLGKALERNRKAARNFESFAPSYRRMYVAWVLDAKREDTRRRRIRIVVRRSAMNTKPGIDM